MLHAYFLLPGRKNNFAFRYLEITDFTSSVITQGCHGQQENNQSLNAKKPIFISNVSQAPFLKTEQGLQEHVVPLRTCAPLLHYTPFSKVYKANVYNTILDAYMH